MERFLIQGSQFPVIVYHAEGTLPASFDALAAEQALVGVIGKYETFFFPIKDRHVDGIGRTVHRAQTAARANLRIPLQETAQAGRVNLPYEWVILGGRPVEQGAGYI